MTGCLWYECCGGRAGRQHGSAGRRGRLIPSREHELGPQCNLFHPQPPPALAPEVSTHHLLLSHRPPAPARPPHAWCMHRGGPPVGPSRHPLRRSQPVTHPVASPHPFIAAQTAPRPCAARSRTPAASPRCRSTCVRGPEVERRSAACDERGPGVAETEEDRVRTSRASLPPSCLP
jgi:hypothetical protein